MKYKVGDKVRIREDLVMGGIYGGSVAVDDMVDMCGNVVTIENIITIGRDDEALGYYIKEDPNSYLWTDEMFEPVEEELTAEVSIRRENPTEVVKVLEQWKADHEKKPIETEFACVVRVIEDMGKVKRCVYEEDITEEKDETFKMSMKRVLEEYCKKHKGKFFAVYEEICRVKE